jgi:hypothetical protein
MPGEDEARFKRAIAAIDAANADDPETLTLKGKEVPKEQTHAEMATRWVQRLRPEASEALLLAARAHHIRRWERPRADYPAGRQGYLRWRRDLQVFHAETVGDILREAGYDEGTVDRVGAIIRKRGLGRDEDVQAFEDALSLVFLETQLHEFSPEHDEAKVVDILRKTWRKMSAAAREAALAFDFAPEDRRLIEAALSN